MWEDFILSWELFAEAWLTGWILAVLLTIVGVVLVAQRQAFVGVAAAQFTTLGIALALWVGEAFHLYSGGHGLVWSSGILFAILACVSLAFAGRESQLLVWLYLAGASGSVLVLSQSPHGLEELQRLMLSSVIGADWVDVGVFGLGCVLAILVCRLRGRTILLVATDPVTAAALGIRTRTWRIGIALVAGTVLGASIHATGVLFVFGKLVLPVFAAINIARTMRTLLWLAPTLSLMTSLCAFMIANHHDLPPAQTAVGMDALLLAFCMLYRLFVRTR